MPTPGFHFTKDRQIMIYTGVVFLGNGAFVENTDISTAFLIGSNGIGVEQSTHVDNW